MLSTKGKPAPLPSSPLLSSKLKQASLNDEQPASAAPAVDANGEERQEMKQFWEEHSKTATVEEMMLDSKASEIDQQERPEVKTSFFFFEHRGWTLLIVLHRSRLGGSGMGEGKRAGGVRRRAQVWGLVFR